MWYTCIYILCIYIYILCIYIYYVYIYIYYILLHYILSYYVILYYIISWSIPIPGIACNWFISLLLKIPICNSLYLVWACLKIGYTKS